MSLSFNTTNTFSVPVTAATPPPRRCRRRRAAGWRANSSTRNVTMATKSATSQRCRCVGCASRVGLLLLAFLSRSHSHTHLSFINLTCLPLSLSSLSFSTSEPHTHAHAHAHAHARPVDSAFTLCSSSVPRAHLGRRRATATISRATRDAAPWRPRPGNENGNDDDGNDDDDGDGYDDDDDGARWRVFHGSWCLACVHGCRSRRCADRVRID